MANTRVSKKITGELRDQLLALDEKDITSSFIYDLFGEYKGKSKCNPYDILESNNRVEKLGGWEFLSYSKKLFSDEV